MTDVANATKKNLLSVGLYRDILKIWCDILTPGQLLFFEHIVGRLRRNHQVLCTSPEHDGMDALGDACSLG